MNTEIINIIRDSFELWYNKTFLNTSKVSIVFNYSDLQTLAIKAYHTVKMEVCAIWIKDNHSFSTSLLQLQENYNHGITTEQEAKEGMIKKLLVALYGYMR